MLSILIYSAAVAAWLVLLVVSVILKVYKLMNTYTLERVGGKY